MKNNLSCEIIEDLLPSYIDGLTSAVTDSAVRDHISHCDRCKLILENMKEPYNEEKIFREKKEIDFLKKTRKRNIRVIASGFIIFILIAVITIALSHILLEMILVLLWFYITLMLMEILLV